jgi:hypothetical protein
MFVKNEIYQRIYLFDFKLLNLILYIFIILIKEHIELKIVISFSFLKACRIKIDEDEIKILKIYYIFSLIIF